MQYGRNIRFNDDWHKKIPGGLPDERILEDIGSFYPKYFFDLLTNPVITNVGDKWKELIREHVITSIYEVNKVQN